MFKKGDQVRLVSDNPNYMTQANGRIGIIENRLSLNEPWWRIMWDHNDTNVYPESDIVFAISQALPDPDFSLEEIHQAQELIHDV